MGLDIYVGPLCRYYAGAWQTVVQQWGEREGIPIKVVRPKGSGLRAVWQKMLACLTIRRSTDPIAIVQTWRNELAAQGRFGSGKDWNWPESLEVAYETDKPNFDGYGAVQLWAAYAERPLVQKPRDFSNDWTADAVFAQVNLAPSEFGHLIGPELWLPVSFDEVFEAEEPNGNRPKIGSVFAMLRQLRRLNQISWNAPEDAVRQWRRDDYNPESFESIARWGFSIWFCLAESAASKRLPMRLDY